MAPADTTATAPVFLPVTEVASRYRVSVPTIWRWAREGRFPQPVKLGDNCTRWPLARLQEYDAKRGEVA